MSPPENIGGVWGYRVVSMKWPKFVNFRRRRDDNKNRICGFEGGGQVGAKRKIVQDAFFCGKRHDNTILKVQIVLSRNLLLLRSLLNVSGILYSSFQEKFAEIALIMDAPFFVETLFGPCRYPLPLKVHTCDTGEAIVRLPCSLLPSGGWR